MADIDSIDQIQKDLNSNNVETRKSAIRALGELEDDQATDLLLRIIANENELYEIVNAALRALSQKTDKRIISPVLSAYSRFNSDTVKMSAIFALAGIKDPDVVDPLIKVLKYGPDGARRNAAHLLGENAYVPAVNALFDAYNTEKIQAVRYSIVTALGVSGDKRAASTLIDALNDADDYMRKTAAESLGKLGDPIAIDYLKEKINDKDPSVREQVAIALSKLENK